MTKRQLRFFAKDLEEGDVFDGVGSDDGRRVPSVAGDRHGDGVRTLDDMVVRHDLTVRREDHPGPGRRTATFEGIEGRVDVDDGGVDLGGDGGRVDRPGSRAPGGGGEARRAVGHRGGARERPRDRGHGNGDGGTTGGEARGRPATWRSPRRAGHDWGAATFSSVGRLHRRLLASSRSSPRPSYGRRASPFLSRAPAPRPCRRSLPRGGAGPGIRSVAIIATTVQARLMPSCAIPENLRRRCGRRTVRFSP